jgi:hypothetical protein
MRIRVLDYPKAKAKQMHVLGYLYPRQPAIDGWHLCSFMPLAVTPVLLYEEKIAAARLIRLQTPGHFAVRVDK